MPLLTDPLDPVAMIPAMSRMRSTTVLLVRRDGVVRLAGDGQVTLGNTVLKAGASKVKRAGRDKVLVGFSRCG